MVRTMLREGAKFNIKKGTLYASRLKDLPCIIALIVTYNFYPYKNHMELTSEALLIIYNIINKISLNWGWFIMWEMRLYKSDPPFSSLISKFLDYVLLKTLDQLKYESGRAGYTIKDNTITRMGLPITPKQKAQASSSQVPPESEDQPTQDDQPDVGQRADIFPFLTPPTNTFPMMSIQVS